MDRRKTICGESLFWLSGSWPDVFAGGFRLGDTHHLEAVDAPFRVAVAAADKHVSSAAGTDELALPVAALARLALVTSIAFAAAASLDALFAAIALHLALTAAGSAGHVT